MVALPVLGARGDLGSATLEHLLALAIRCSPSDDRVRQLRLTLAHEPQVRHLASHEQPSRGVRASLLGTR